MTSLTNTGSMADTFLMILLPLYVTANVVHCNVWTYMAFGSLYANWLTLIHSEYSHAWDPAFRLVGFGTAADHHVHHKLFKYNYGHLFMYWDMLAGTYRAPASVKEFNLGV
jgi:sterol desaturase/sphingolipid hydroxylase (fatty acid hydroxylase superfamily)